MKPVARAAPKPNEGPGPYELAEVGIVALAVAQGLLVGAWLGVFPAMALRAGGFPAAPPFFVRWAGVLHLVLAVGYALEWLRFRRVTLLIVAKGITASFLAITWVGEGSLPFLMMIAIVLEAGLAGAAAIVRQPADRSRRTRARLRLVTPAAGAIRPAGQR
jgi:hypothetical protein